MIIKDEAFFMSLCMHEVRAVFVHEINTLCPILTGDERHSLEKLFR